MTTQTHAGTIPEWTVRDRLRKAREEVGLSQGELADRVGITRTMVANVENGRTAPRPIVLRMWALCTGVDGQWLQTGEAPRPDGPDEGLEYTAWDSNPEPADSGLATLAPVVLFPSRGLDDERRTA